MTKIKKDTVYTAREAFQFFPEIGSEPSFRKFVLDDISTANRLHASVIKRNKQLRFYLRGSDIINYLQTV